VRDNAGTPSCGARLCGNCANDSNARRCSRGQPYFAGRWLFWWTAARSRRRKSSPGLQDPKRPRVFGMRRAGAALPSMFERLPDGDGFQCYGSRNNRSLTVAAPIKAATRRSTARWLGSRAAGMDGDISMFSPQPLPEGREKTRPQAGVGKLKHAPPSGDRRAVLWRIAGTTLDWKERQARLIGRAGPAIGNLKDVSPARSLGLRM